MRRQYRWAAAVVAAVCLGAFTTACQADRIYTYRVATRGPVSADMAEFGDHVASTLADPRGWTLGGSMAFTRTDGPADFTIWLSTADNLRSFSSACSSEWSCRAGSNVVINQDRWLGASSTWPYGIDTYRHYVVNHEVGHWLGLSHQTCPASGERAPVMVQQSKGGSILGNCRFNVWPTENERQTVASVHGVAALSTGVPTPDDPFGALDITEVIRDADGRPARVRVAGWAIDGDTTNPLSVVMNIDGQPVIFTAADLVRDDVAGAFPRFGPSHGFDVTFDVVPSAQIVCVNALGTGSGLAAGQLGCAVVK